MEIGIELDADGYLGDRYAKHADAAHLYAGTPTCSFPFELTGIPAGAASIALAFYDLDSIPVCGFAWVHWTAACIDAGLAEGGRLRFVEDASNLGALGMVQGRNSSAGRMAGGSEDPLLCCRYNGPQPPDCDHGRGSGQTSSSGRRAATCSRRRASTFRRACSRDGGKRH